MERNFLSLNSMEPLPSTVKPEISGQENQWPFMKKVSSFRGGVGQDDGMSKLVTESIKSSPFFPGSTTDAFCPNKISSMAEIQNFSLSLSNQMTKSSFVGFGQNFTESVIRQQFEGFQKVVSTPTGQVVGFTEPWNSSSKARSPHPPQMTIFYGGTVSVYEGISPEKAQAIMLLAGNGSFLGSNKNSPIASNIVDGVIPKQHLNPQPHAEKYEQKAVKTNENSCFLAVIKPEVQRVIPSRGPTSMPAMMPSAVPQFRKASLARFLEKRKERVMNAGPYTCEKKQADDVNPANEKVGSAANSGTSPTASAQRN